MYVIKIGFRSDSAKRRRGQHSDVFDVTPTEEQQIVVVNSGKAPLSVTTTFALVEPFQGGLALGASGCHADRCAHAAVAGQACLSTLRACNTWTNIGTRAVKGDPRASRSACVCASRATLPETLFAAAAAAVREAANTCPIVRPVFIPTLQDLGANFFDQPSGIFRSDGCSLSGALRATSGRGLIGRVAALRRVLVAHISSLPPGN